MHAKSRAGDDQEALVRQAGDGEVALDAAALVQALGVDHRANRHVDLVGADIVEEFERAGAAHFDLVEGGLVEQAGVLARLQMLVADRARPVVVRPSPWVRARGGPALRKA